MGRPEINVKRGFNWTTHIVGVGFKPTPTRKHIRLATVAVTFSWKQKSHLEGEFKAARRLSP
jgi:hypothetical protein